MLQLVNHTPFSASLSVFPDAVGIESAYAVVKASFVFGEDGPELAPQQLPLLATDVFWGDPMKTSLRVAGEIGLPRIATDVLLIGRAVAQEPDTQVADVSLRVGPVQRTVRVFGDRHWERAGKSWRPSEPLPWQRLPLRWELAWGGMAPSKHGEMPDHEPRNPVGRGFVGRDDLPFEGQPLPNLEDPAHLIVQPHDRPVPACFGPIAPTWMPRRSFAGTYDEAWIRGRAPYLPFDFDARFLQVAPPVLIAPSFLQGGEPVRLDGFFLGDAMEFELPDCGLAVEFDFDGRETPRPANLEMLLFEPDAGRFQMVWRAGIAVDKKLLKLKHAVIRSDVFERDGSRRGPLAEIGRLPRAYANAQAQAS